VSIGILYVCNDDRKTYRKPLHISAEKRMTNPFLGLRFPAFFFNILNYQRFVGDVAELLFSRDGSCWVRILYTALFSKNLMIEMANLRVFLCCFSESPYSLMIAIYIYEFL
jgi:hypothetical protein